MAKKPTLQEHRQALENNNSRYEHDIKRAIDTWVNKHAYQYYQKVFFQHPLNIRKLQLELKEYLTEMAELVFDAQGRRPLFEIGDRVYAWNAPKDFDKDYIRYETGHLKPRNSGGDSRPENLCFQSARCNQHIQSALLIEEVMFLIGDHHPEIRNRISSLEALHNSDSWSEIKEKIVALTAVQGRM